MPTQHHAHPQHHQEIKTLLEWVAPGRPFVKRGKQYFATALLIMFFVEIILFLFSQYMLMLVVVSLVFVSFAFASVPPHDFRYRISTQGFFVEDKFFLWQELYDFFFTKQHNQNVLIIRTKVVLPGEIVATLGEVSEEKIRTTLLQFLPYREFVTPTFIEKTSNWLSNTFPLEPTETPTHKVASKK